MFSSRIVVVLVYSYPNRVTKPSGPRYLVIIRSELNQSMITYCKNLIGQWMYDFTSGLCPEDVR